MAKDRKKRTAAAPADETKAARFSRLASARVTKAVRAIKNIGNLSGRSYEYSDAQVETIKGYLTDATKSALAAFASGGTEKAAEELKI